jgi:hypothetical protein
VVLHDSYFNIQISATIKPLLWDLADPRGAEHCRSETTNLHQLRYLTSYTLVQRIPKSRLKNQFFNNWQHLSSPLGLPGEEELNLCPILLTVPNFCVIQTCCRVSSRWRVFFLSHQPLRHCQESCFQASCSQIFGLRALAEGVISTHDEDSVYLWQNSRAAYVPLTLTAKWNNVGLPEIRSLAETT